jgi:hypothetical protein
LKLERAFPVLGGDEMKKLLVVLAMVMVGTAAAAPPCWACSCAPSGTSKKEQAKNADVIFTGRVRDVAEPLVDGDGISGNDPVEVRFRVRKIYKGHPRTFTKVFTNAEGSLCGVEFKEDTRYTVFAKRLDGKKWTYHCMGTKEGPIHPDDYGLGDGYPPRTRNDPNTETR